MTATTSTARITTAQLAAKVDTLAESVSALVALLAGQAAGQFATSAAVVDIASAPSAGGRRPRKAAATKAAPTKASAGKAKTTKAPKATDPQAQAKRAEQAQAWAQHKEIRSLVNKAYVAAGVKFTAGTLDRFADEAAVSAMLAKIDPSRKADAEVFVAKMVAKHNAA